MLDTAPPLSPDAASGDPADPRRAHDLRLLEELTDAAMALARAFQAKALAVLETAQTPDEHAVAVGHGRAFDRHARTVRQCLALKDRLLNGPAARQSRAQDRPAAIVLPDQFPVVTPQQIVQRRIDVGEALRASVHAADRTPLERERLLAEIDAFVDDDESLGWGGVSEILWRQCVVLGLPFEPERWADTAWAREEIATQPKGSAYAGYRPGGGARPP